MDLFFVISGFVIVHVAGVGRFAPGPFLARRVWRVVPLYWLLTLLVAGAAAAGPAMFRTTRYANEYLLKSLLFFPATRPGASDWRPLFKLGWTLNYEMFFYVAVAATFWCTKVQSRVAVLTAVLGVLILASFAMPASQAEIAFYANLNLMPFVAGMWLAAIWNRDAFATAGPGVRVAALVTAATLAFAFYTTPFDRTKLAAGHLLMSASATAMVVAALLHESHAARWRVANWLGDISYSLYLTHMFVVGVGWAILTRLGIVVVESPVGLASAAVLVAASLAVAQISYTTIERPLMRMRIGKRRAAVPEARAN